MCYVGNAIYSIVNICERGRHGGQEEPVKDAPKQGSLLLSSTDP